MNLQEAKKERSRLFTEMNEAIRERYGRYIPNTVLLELNDQPQYRKYRALGLIIWGSEELEEIEKEEEEKQKRAGP